MYSMHQLKTKTFIATEQSDAGFTISLVHMKAIKSEEDKSFVRIEPTDLSDGTHMTFECSNIKQSNDLYEAMVACYDINMGSTL